MVLYRESGRLIELDFTMSENPLPINLYNENLVRPQFVLHSKLNNGYWIYDASKYQLMHYDKNFQLEFSSGNILQLTSFTKFIVSKLIIDGSRVYLESEENGILMFDQYAALIKKIPLPKTDNFFVENNTLIFTKGNSITLTDDKFINISTLEFDEVPSEIIVKNTKVYFLSTKGIKIYRLEPNEDK